MNDRIGIVTRGLLYPQERQNRCVALSDALGHERNFCTAEKQRDFSPKTWPRSAQGRGVVLLSQYIAENNLTADHLVALLPFNVQPELDQISAALNQGIPLKL
jgi:hypothetical protein